MVALRETIDSTNTEELHVVSNEMLAAQIWQDTVDLVQTVNGDPKALREKAKALKDENPYLWEIIKTYFKSPRFLEGLTAPEVPQDVLEEPMKDGHIYVSGFSDAFILLARAPSIEKGETTPTVQFGRRIDTTLGIIDVYSHTVAVTDPLQFGLGNVANTHREEMTKAYRSVEHTFTQPLIDFLQQSPSGTEFIGFMPVPDAFRREMPGYLLNPQPDAAAAD